MSPKHPDVEQAARDVLELDGLRPAQRAALDEPAGGPRHPRGAGDRRRQERDLPGWAGSRSAG
nr:hypothetical protein [Angustibacter aerolatus]